MNKEEEEIFKHTEYVGFHGKLIEKGIPKMNKHKNPADGLIETLKQYSWLDTEKHRYIERIVIKNSAIKALKEYREAVEQPECKDGILYCPLFPSYYEYGNKLGKLQRQINVLRNHVHKLMGIKEVKNV